ncbi:hypothetical protein M8C21_020482 [Ambrosia artemisiifolia]|uniref:Uncharacterized protein n=1 Tax=Ambrosia artemisiifolia TaxID=4212 RepID=A0AAD5CCX2_AMBAR|nr:hypothetical protein M8C21_020482 [Ambrosia artemisiifolia]
MHANCLTKCFNQIFKIFMSCLKPLTHSKDCISLALLQPGRIGDLHWLCSCRKKIVKPKMTRHLLVLNMFTICRTKEIPRRRWLESVLQKWCDFVSWLFIIFLSFQL